MVAVRGVPPWAPWSQCRLCVKWGLVIAKQCRPASVLGSVRQNTRLLQRYCMGFGVKGSGFGVGVLHSALCLQLHGVTVRTDWTPKEGHRRTPCERQEHGKVALQGRTLLPAVPSVPKAFCGASMVYAHLQAGSRS